MWLLFGTLVTFVWVSLIRSLKWRRFFSDVPNARSSHATVTSRGAGFAFAIAFFLPSLAGTFFWLALCGLLVAALGLTDDMFSCSAKIRFQLQALFAFLVLIPVLTALPASLILKVVFGAILLIIVLASINFYNFADGINGHIALQSVVSLGSWMWLLGLNDIQPGLLALFGGLLFFLWANMIKRWVFMGDAGSTFLGFLLAVLPLYALAEPTLNSILQHVLLSLTFSFVIFMDCTSILAVKIWKGLPLTMPHRNHFYQELSRGPGWNHSRASLYLAIAQCLISVGGVAALKISTLFGFQALAVAGLYTYYVVRNSLMAAKDLALHLTKESNLGPQL